MVKPLPTGLEQGPQIGVGRRGHRESQVHGGHQSDGGLPEELLPRGHAFGIAVDDLAVIIHPADPAEAERHQQHHPDEAVGPVRPQQSADGDGNQDQHATHGGGAGLDQVGLGTVRTDGLADLHLGQLADHARAGDQPDQQGGGARQHGAQRDVFEHAQGAHIIGKQTGQLKQHGCLPAPGPSVRRWWKSRHYPLHAHKARTFDQYAGRPQTAQGGNHFVYRCAGARAFAESGGCRTAGFAQRNERVEPCSRA